MDLVGLHRLQTGPCTSARTVNDIPLLTSDGESAWPVETKVGVLPLGTGAKVASYFWTMINSRSLVVYE